MSETTPLVGSNGNGSSGPNGGKAFYFQNMDKGESELTQYESVTDNDGGQVVEELPPGTTLRDFEPRAIGAVPKVRIRLQSIFLHFCRISKHHQRRRRRRMKTIFPGSNYQHFDTHRPLLNYLIDRLILLVICLCMCMYVCSNDRKRANVAPACSANFSIAVPVSRRTNKLLTRTGSGRW